MPERILVVDDEIFIRESVADYLEDYDYLIDMACNGSEAFDKIQLQDYDLIITDLAMPVMGGMELIARTNELYPMIPKIIVTGTGELKDAIEAIRNGAYDFITKPIEDFEHFLITVRRALEKRKLTLNNIKYQFDLEKTNKLLQEKLDELEKVQTQLVQSAKMASLGILAAGIAHEINNPNSFVNANVQVLKNYLNNLAKFITVQEEYIYSLPEPNEELKSLKTRLKIDYILKDVEKLISDSFEGTLRIKSIVSDLKEFSRLDKPLSEEYNINAGLRSTLNILRHELKKGVQVFEDYGKIPLLRCHPQQINQVFMNILINSVHAIDRKGEIHIKTFLEENEIIVYIKDSGCGIFPAHLPFIFDPFFTTKETGKGMGLGLSLSYKIIEKHGGKIEVTSEVGKGTKFIVRLPV
jgi:signal transduction histidine kinase